MAVKRYREYFIQCDNPECSLDLCNSIIADSKRDAIEVYNEENERKLPVKGPHLCDRCWADKQAMERTDSETLENS